MFKKLLGTALLASFIAGLAAGCNTVQGAGKDIERGGEKIQQEAQEHK
jgi:entericidin B